MAKKRLSKQNLDALRVLSEKSPLFALLRLLVVPEKNKYCNCGVFAKITIYGTCQRCGREVKHG